MSDLRETGCCGGTTTLIFPCSGASDVGELGHQAARRLTREGVGKMYCLAGIGGQVDEILVNTRGATRLLAIDGCEKDCAAKCLSEAGFTNVARVRVTDLGFVKGASPVVPEEGAEKRNRMRPVCVRR